MTISIRAAVKNIFSGIYDKRNMLYYGLLILIGGICGIYMSQGGENIPATTLKQSSFAYLVYFFVSILSLGLYILSANNGYKTNNNVLANLFDDFKKIATTGVVSFVGFMIYELVLFILIFISFLICLIFCYIAYLISPKLTIILAIIFAIIFAILLTFFIIMLMGLFLNYTKSLEFEDLLNVKKGFIFISNNRKLFSLYILKSITVGIIAVLFFLPIFLVTVLGISIPSIFNNITLSNVQLGLIGAIIGSISGLFCSLIQMDLEIQFLRESYTPPTNERDDDFLYFENNNTDDDDMGTDEIFDIETKED
ncbi:hypothetical protein IJ182_08290 [bacterium]|nr:hypothetical protein [bacterium]